MCVCFAFVPSRVLCEEGLFVLSFVVLGLVGYLGESGWVGLGMGRGELCVCVWRDREREVGVMMVRVPKKRGGGGFGYSGFFFFLGRERGLEGRWCGGSVGGGGGGFGCCGVVGMLRGGWFTCRCVVIFIVLLPGGNIVIAVGIFISF